MGELPEMDVIGEIKRNWDKRGLDEVEAMLAATSIARGHQIVLGRINSALSPFSLTFSRYEALALLGFTRSGRLPMARMGERLQVHPTSITSTIDRLERDKLVTRTPHPSDRRATLAGITRKGRQVLDDATDALEAIRWGLGDVSAPVLDELSGAMAHVRRSAGDNVSESLPESTRSMR